MIDQIFDICGEILENIELEEYEYIEEKIKHIMQIVLEYDSKTN